ncbi:MAG: zinc ribbon domain-containing protein [Thermoplasmata archaeon]
MAKVYKICSKCGAKVWGKAEYCPICDTDISSEKLMVEDSEERSGKIARECPKCGALVYSKSEECPICNADLSHAQIIENVKKVRVKTECKRCGATLFSETCPFCEDK